MQLTPEEIAQALAAAWHGPADMHIPPGCTDLVYHCYEMGAEAGAQRLHQQNESMREQCKSLIIKCAAYETQLERLEQKLRELNVTL